MQQALQPTGGYDSLSLVTLPIFVRPAAVSIALLLLPHSGTAWVAKPSPPIRSGAIGAAPRLAYEQIRVLSLSLEDQRAVIQFPAGDQRVLAVGDEVPEIDVRVVQVLRDRLVLLERPVPRQTATAGTAAHPPATGRQVWIYRYSGTGTSRVQVLDRSIPAASGQRSKAPEPPRQKPPGS